MRYLSAKYCFVLIVFFFLFQGIDFGDERFPPVEKYNLSNGCTVILAEDNQFPLVTIQLWVRAGSCFEGKFMGAGITHLVEHMVFKGEETKAAIRLSRQLQELGGEIDAATSKEYTYFTLTIPASNLAEAMLLLYDIIVKPEFIPEELNKEKEVIIREMDLLTDDPYRFLADKFFNLAYQGHPYALPVIGRQDLFLALTRKEVQEYYQSQYVPDNFILIVSGDFETGEIKPLIEELWGSLPDKNPQCQYMPERPPVVGPLEEIIYKKISGAYMVTGFYGPDITSHDIFAMDILAEIAGGGKDSRLMKKLRDDLGLVSSIQAWSYTPSCTGIWGVSADLVDTDWEKVKDEINREIYGLQSRPISARELDRAKKRIKSKVYSGLETTSGRAQDFGINEVFTRNPEFNSSYIDGINKVTEEDLKRVAGKYFIRQGQATAVLLPEQSRPQPEVAGEQDINEKITSIKLDNGIRVLVKNDSRTPLVTIRLAALGGLLEEDIPGQSYLSSQAWIKENHNLVAEIESLGGDLAVYSGNNSFGCSVSVWKDDVNKGLQAVKELVQNLSVSGGSINRARKIQLVKIKQEQDSAYGYAFKIAKKVFFGKNPYSNSILGTPESVARIQEKDIADFLKKHLVSDNMVISVFGQIDPEQTVAEIRDIFGILIQRGYSPRGKFPPIEQKINRKKVARDTEQEIVILAYPGVSIYNEKRAAVQLLAQVFSGQAGRLFQYIREEEALSYSVGALNIMGRIPGSFMFYIATGPWHAAEASDYLFSEVSRVKENGIEAEELDRVKKYVITQLQKEWEDINGFSEEVTLDELYGLGHDYYRKYIREIARVTVADVKAAAQDCFRDDWHTLIIIGPEDKNPDS